MALDGDHVYAHGSEVLCVKGCVADDGLDLIAVSGLHSVVVLSYTPSACDLVASFYLGTAANALAWSPRASSPLAGSDFHIELVAATSDGQLRHLYKSEATSETITNIKPDGILAHTGHINDLTFCGDISRGSGWRYLASTADDTALVIWDIFPSTESNTTFTPREASMDSISSSLIPPGNADTWPISFPNPLHSVAAHLENAKHLLVADSSGSVYLVNWQLSCSLASRREEQVIMEFIEPRSLSRLLFSPAPSLTGLVSWKRDDVNTLVATFGDRWALWEQLSGSKPLVTGSAFSTGARCLRWCPTDPNLFALSPLSQAHGAILHIHNVGFLNSPPTRFEIAVNPHYIQDFDWLGVTYKESPLVAVATGKLVHILRIGESPDKTN